MKKTHTSVTQGGSALARYQQVIVGRKSFSSLIYFEFCAWLGHIPGAAGLVLRKIFWPRLFRSCGKGVLFAENVVLRHPKRVSIGNRVVVSEGCVLDGRHTSSDRAITIGDDVILSVDVVLSCKNGSISIGARSGLGAQTVFAVGEDCTVQVGDDVAIGPHCSITAGGYNTDRHDIPIIQQGILADDAIIEDNVWLGAHVTMIGGARVGHGSIVASGGAVISDIPPMTVCGGVPARPLKSRIPVPEETAQ
ncbi:MAG: hypothetical protein HYX75_13060 [Acidobacteria bacterium]|nr:hypothetical protein [Acidobacteriota bacterium]